jgi:hypothetical protein
VDVSSTNIFPNGTKQSVFWSISQCSKNYGHYREEKVSQIWLYTQNESKNTKDPSMFLPTF